MLPLSHPASPPRLEKSTARTSPKIPGRSKKAPVRAKAAATAAATLAVDSGGSRSTKSGDEHGKRCGANAGDAIGDLIGDDVASGTTNAERNSPLLSIARPISQSKSASLHDVSFAPWLLLDESVSASDN